jgi:hypothetical protein
VGARVYRGGSKGFFDFVLKIVEVKSEVNEVTSFFLKIIYIIDHVVK